MIKMNMDRRRFLALSGAALGTSLVGLGSLPALAGGRKLKNIGIQLYTVRDHMKNSVPETLKALAGFGYKEMEFAGYFGHSPKEIKAMLADLGLTAPSTHVGINEFRKDIAAPLDHAVEVGHDYITVPFLNKKERTLDHYKAHAELFNKIGEEANKRGIRFGYHNHSFEFDVEDGVTPYDLLLERVDAENMQMTMDLFWITEAGRDPFEYFEKHPGRFEQCHVKDMAADGAMVDVGAGTIDFSRIFAASKQAGFKHYHVEHDRPTDSLLSAENSVNYLKTLTF